MSKSKGVVLPSRLESGDIIQIPNPAQSVRVRRETPFIYGYVHHIVYDTQKNDEVSALEVLPILSEGRASEPRLKIESDFRLESLPAENIDKNSGLDQNRHWAMVLQPLRLYPTKADLGGEDGMTRCIGSLKDSKIIDALWHKIESLFTDEFQTYGLAGAPRMKRFDFEKAAPFVIESRYAQAEEKATRVRKERKASGRKAKFEGKVVDLDLDKADKLGLDSDIIALFTQPQNAALAIESLRTLFDLVTKTPEALAVYLPEAGPVTAASAPVGKIALADLSDEIHIGVINGLAEPREGADVLPITDLESAYELITQRPEDLQHYSYMGPKMREYAVNNITAAYEARQGGINLSAISLKDLTDDEITIAVVNGLAEPRKGADVQPVTDLKSAYDLVTQRPEDLKHYMYMGPKIREYAIKEITAAVEARRDTAVPAFDADAVASKIKSAWSKLGAAVLLNIKDMPPAYLDDHNKPIWKMVPSAPR